MDLSTLNPVEQASIYIGHIQQAQADALNATLRAARAKAADNTEVAEAEQKQADAAVAAVEAITAMIPNDLQSIVEAQAALRKKDAEQQFVAAQRVISGDDKQPSSSASSDTSA